MRNHFVKVWGRIRENLAGRSVNKEVVVAPGELTTMLAIAEKHRITVSKVESTE